MPSWAFFNPIYMTGNIQHNKHILKLELLGIGSKRYQHLKGNLRAALEDLGLDIPINEVTEINKILEYDIFGIPAVLLNGKIIFQDQLPPSNEIIDSLKLHFSEITTIPQSGSTDEQN